MANIEIEVIRAGVEYVKTLKKYSMYVPSDVTEKQG